MVWESCLRVCFVCSGNICRSPMAEVVLRQLAEVADLGDRILVDSAGTGDWHIGERADRRAVEALAARGYDGSGHRARQFDPRWFAGTHRVIALDHGHLRTLRSWAGNEAERTRVALLRSFDPAIAAEPGPGAVAWDVADPYYDGPAAFEDVLGQIERACAGLLAQLRHDLEPVS